MNITSLGFLLFLGGGLTLFYCIPQRYRWKWLIVLSFVFIYSASVFGLFFVVLTSVIIYIAARRIEDTNDEKKKLLVLTIGLCLFILIFIKYLSGLPFFSQRSFLFLGSELTIQSVIKKYLLPIGMSYYTLQVISYLLDVYWGRISAEKNYWKVLLFTCYFPQLVQGPISKYSEISPELFKEHYFEWKNIKYGVQLMIWGYFKKMLIADRIGVNVNAIFHGEGTPYGLTAWIGLVFYGIQLYCDFSGGIDVIRGASECLDIGIKDNFRQPYFSLSLGEFWRRWHISLGTWMKDYIFYPVSMATWMGRLKKRLKNITSRKNANRIGMAIADLMVFALVGVWHGLGTNYLAWGLYNGIILAISAILIDDYVVWKNKLHIDSKSRSWKIFCLIRTLFIVTIGWIFDCTYTASEAGTLFIHLFEFRKTNLSLITMTSSNIALFFCGVIVLTTVDILHEKNISIRKIIASKNYWFQVIFWTIVVQLIACFGRVASSGGFMYANF